MARRPNPEGSASSATLRALTANVGLDQLAKSLAHEIVAMDPQGGVARVEAIRDSIVRRFKTADTTAREDMRIVKMVGPAVEAVETCVRHFQREHDAEK